MVRQKHPELTLSRATKFFNRLCTRLLVEKIPVKMEISEAVKRITRQEALCLKYKNVELGYELKPAWSTHWLKIKAEIPSLWKGQTVVLRFHTGSEALLWLEGAPFHGFNSEDQPIFNDQGRAEAVLPAHVIESGKLECEVEIACNGLWGASSNTASFKGENFKLFEVQLARRDEEVWSFAHDLVILVKWLEELPELKTPEAWNGLPVTPPTSKKMTPWPGYVLKELNNFCNVCDTEDRATWPAGREILRKIFQHHNATYATQITAVGHAHIDTAWLWPLGETKRKCSRSFSTALHIMDRYPSFRFACSQAQQYVWMKEEYPELYARIRAAAKRGQWLPVGGTWIEPDCNIPSGESLVRQFLLGQRFFKQEFGSYCREFWNPDVFGYSGALPQIMRGVGIEFFLTQKLSWNQFNKPRHQNFYWEGIDGSRVLTHFPPADTYNALDFGNLIKHFHQHERNAQDHDRVNDGMLLFGCGDGGGGATHHMMEVIERLEDFQGFPRVSTGRPDDFFDRLKKSLSESEAPVQVGELYFEYHRGTYTTQAANKRDNRRSERLLREVELLAALAHSDGTASYPRNELKTVWEKVLLNQFHDILPGSSITEVYDDSAADYKFCLNELAELKSVALPATVPDRASAGFTLVNTLGWERRGVVKLPDETLALVQAPSCGYAPVVNLKSIHGKVSAYASQKGWILENGLVQTFFNSGGALVSMRDLVNDRDVLQCGAVGNHFKLFEDYPHAWDAWDMDPTHLEKFWDITACDARLVETDPLRGTVEFTYVFGESRMSCQATLKADSPLLEFTCELDWKHRERFLKVEFPVNVYAPEAAFEIQFGHVKRATHFNTSYDVARFESPAHFWVDLSEEGYGVALLNDSKYGHAVHGQVMRLSLVRGTTAPDPKADLGQHTFRYGLLPHLGSLVNGEVVRRAQEFNTDWSFLPGASAGEQSWFQLDSDHILLDTIKKAEDSDDLILRLYECHGARGNVRLSTSLPYEKAGLVNLLEEQFQSLPSIVKGEWKINFKPFEILTVQLKKK